MSKTILGLVMVAVLSVPQSASAFGWRAWRTAYYSYYYPVPVVAYSPVVFCVPAYTATVIAPVAAAPRSLAQPIPAPPSRAPATPRTQEPPLSAPATPGISESRKVPGATEELSYFNAYALAVTDAGSLIADRCRVSFWNLTDRPLTVKVADQSYVVQRNSQSMPMELSRQFVWRVDGREPQQERLPEGESGLVIVIRR